VAGSLHDLLHAATDILIAVGLAIAMGSGVEWYSLQGWAGGFWSSPLAFGLLYYPILQEVWDYGRFRVLTGKWGLPGRDSLHDPATHAGAWAVVLFQYGHGWLGLAALVPYLFYIYWWNFIVLKRRREAAEISSSVYLSKLWTR